MTFERDRRYAEASFFDAVSSDPGTNIWRIRSVNRRKIDPVSDCILYNGKKMDSAGLVFIALHNRIASITSSDSFVQNFIVVLCYS